MEELARANLPAGYDFAWSGQSLEERLAGGQSGFIFGLSLLLVYLVLSAQYESFVLPLIILLGVPLAVFGAFRRSSFAGSATTCSARSGWCCSSASRRRTRS